MKTYTDIQFKPMSFSEILKKKLDRYVSERKAKKFNNEIKKLHIEMASIDEEIKHQEQSNLDRINELKKVKYDTLKRLQELKFKQTPTII